MQAWRHIIAALLILVFAPASVLAAAPLQLCLGNDGHFAIETAFASDHHSTSQHAGHTHSTKLAFAGHVAELDPDCVDVLLQPITEFSSQKSGFSEACAVQNFEWLVASYPQSTPPPFVSELNRVCHHALGGVVEDPRLSLLATIVLRN